jgi:trehalose/maltose transport system substrate-binding protein
LQSGIALGPGSGESEGRLAMRHWTKAALLGAALGIAGSAAQAATISISCGAVGLELQLCQEGANAWA